MEIIKEANLFFEEDRISAIIDWDQSFVAPRTWEILYSVGLCP